MVIKEVQMPISDECYKLAGSLFAVWALINAAHRYATVGEKEKALMATVNARAAIYDAENEGAMTESEARGLLVDSNVVIYKIEKGEFAVGRENLESLSEQVFISSLEKVISCECGEEKSSDSMGYHGGGRRNGHP